MIPEAQHPITILLQKVVALLIIFVLQMLASVQFNDEIMFQTDKIDDIRPDGFLTFEFEAKKSMAPQVIPQPGFCVCHVAAQVFGVFGE